MLVSLILILTTAIISLIFESRSQKLPAVIRSNTVSIKARTDGVLKNYTVAMMQEVTAKDLIAMIDNPILPIQLQSLKKNLEKYEELIASTQDGNLLKSELLDYEEDIQKNKITMDKARLEQNKISDKLEFLAERYRVAKKQYNVNQKLYNTGILSNSEFEKVSQEFWRVYEEYYDLKGDSLIAFETMQSSNNIINSLNERIRMLSEGDHSMSSKYLIEKNEVLIKIEELENSVTNLSVYSPIEGVVTELNYRPGESVAKGNVIAEIADMSVVWVVAYGGADARHKLNVGQKVRIYSKSKNKIWGKVNSLSPVMERVKSQSNMFETVNTYTKIEITFDNEAEVLNYLTPGERLFVRVYYR